ncbi:MAG: hypothetical protein IAF94_14745 [Pirellulaceae bacterium]|nr:hypothetical protein [Pirellulaceae bacterium]
MGKKKSNGAALAEQYLLLPPSEEVLFLARINGRKCLITTLLASGGKAAVKSAAFDKTGRKPMAARDARIRELGESMSAQEIYDNHRGEVNALAPPKSRPVTVFSIGKVLCPPKKNSR